MKKTTVFDVENCNFVEAVVRGRSFPIGSDDPDYVDWCESNNAAFAFAQTAPIEEIERTIPFLPAGSNVKLMMQIIVNTRTGIW